MLPWVRSTGRDRAFPWSEVAPARERVLCNQSYVSTIRLLPCLTGFARRFRRAAVVDLTGGEAQYTVWG